MSWLKKKFAFGDIFSVPPPHCLFFRLDLSPSTKIAPPPHPPPPPPPPGYFACGAHASESRWCFPNRTRKTWQSKGPNSFQRSVNLVHRAQKIP